MAIFTLSDELIFPPVDLAEADGLLAIGGDLSPERLILAYRNGIFPWYQEEPILWWCPHPRFVLFPNELIVTRSLKKILEKNSFRFTVNKAFKQVIRHCKNVPRPGQDGTLITDKIEDAYFRMHEMGLAHSAEVWKDNDLVGGLYGIRLGKVFFGESMFSRVSNASRIAFTLYIDQLKKEGVELIDCQVYTEYLESFGARMIDRDEFSRLLRELTIVS